MAHPSISTAYWIPLEGLVTSTWSFRLMIDFDGEMLRSPLFSSKFEVGTAAGSYINMPFRIITLVLINAVTLANINHESHYFIESTPSFFLSSFMVTTFLLIV